MNSFVEKLLGVFPESKAVVVTDSKNSDKIHSIKFELFQTQMIFYDFKGDVPSCTCRVSGIYEGTHYVRDPFSIPDFTRFALNMTVMHITEGQFKSGNPVHALDDAVKRAADRMAFNNLALSRMLETKDDWVTNRNNVKFFLTDCNDTLDRFQVGILNWGFLPKRHDVDYVCTDVVEFAKLIKVLRNLAPEDLDYEMEAHLKTLVREVQLDVLKDILEFANSSHPRISTEKEIPTLQEASVSENDCLQKSFKTKQLDFRLSDVREDWDAKHVSNLYVEFMRTRFLLILNEIQNRAERGERCFTYVTILPEFIQELERRGFGVEKVDTGFKVSW